MTGSFGGRAILRVDCLSMGGRGSWVSGCWCGLMSVSVDKFDTDLFGEGKLNLLASGGTESSNAFLNLNLRVDNGGNFDGTGLSDISAGNFGKPDGFVNADALGGGVGNGDGDIDGGDNGDIVGGGLGNLFAVVVSIRVSVSTISLVSGLADSDHLDLFLLFEGNGNGLGGGFFGHLVVRVCADFLGNSIDGFSADGTGDDVCEVDFFDDLDGESDIIAGGLNGRCADLSDFSHIDDRAVMFGFLITVSGVVTVSRGGVSVCGGWVIRGGLVV